MEEKPRRFEYDVYMNGGHSRWVSGKPQEQIVKAELSRQNKLAGKWRRLRYVWQSEGFYAMFDELAKMKEEK